MRRYLRVQSSQRVSAYTKKTDRTFSGHYVGSPTVVNYQSYDERQVEYDRDGHVVMWSGLIARQTGKSPIDVGR